MFCDVVCLVLGVVGFGWWYQMPVSDDVVKIDVDRFKIVVITSVVFWSRFMAQDSCPTEDPKHFQVDRRPELRSI